MTDPTSGFQVMRAPVARFFCSDVYPSDYPDADILILLHRSGFRMREVPVQMRPAVGKSMHAGHRSLYYVYKMLLSIFVTLLRRRPPASADRLPHPRHRDRRQPAAAARWSSSSCAGGGSRRSTPSSGC